MDSHRQHLQPLPLGHDSEAIQVVGRHRLVCQRPVQFQRQNQPSETLQVVAVDQLVAVSNQRLLVQVLLLEGKEE